MTCTTCLGSTCVGKHGEDTNATAAAAASAAVMVRFDEAMEVGDYAIAVVPSSVAAVSPSSKPARFQFEVRDQDNKLVATSVDKNQRTVVTGGPGRFYRVDLRLESSAEHRGVYRPERMEGDATVTVDVMRAPILEANFARAGIRMVNGTLEKGFPGVGLIAIRDPVTGANRPHCTGTIIGNRTILTAAHCIVGYENRRMRFQLGWDDEHPEEDLNIQSFDYPDNESGFSYNSSTHADDLAVMYLAEPVNASVPRMVAHSGMPSIDALASNGGKMLFVGYGAYYGGAGPSAVGKKRRLELEITRAQSRTFDNLGIGANTCLGDSGGPAFFTDGGEARVIAGVISQGDLTCLLRGTNTRIEAYADWLRPRIK
jgi:hypothetical protein